MVHLSELDLSELDLGELDLSEIELSEYVQQEAFLEYIQHKTRPGQLL